MVFSFPLSRAIIAAAAALCLSLFATGAQAATVTFGNNNSDGPWSENGFNFDSVSINNSLNCPDPHCVRLNTDRGVMTTMTFDGGAFTAISFDYNLRGNRNNPASLEVTAFTGINGDIMGASETISTPQQQDATHTFGAGFADITALKFTNTTGSRTIHIDNLRAVPEIDAAAGMGSLAALGAMLAFARTRRRHLA